jgi:putative Mn2+ efflux pump MntP
MSLVELLVLSVGLAMDAFAVSVCKGLCTKRVTWKKALAAGLWFGAFQAAMPVAGYFLGSAFRELVEAFDHWIAFGLLLLIGVNMIREAFGEEKENDDFGVKTMLPLAVATSIDALAVGVSFAMSGVSVAPSVTVIGAVTFALCAAGVFAGHTVGKRFGRAARITGGAILILIGTKILLEDLGVFG